MAGKVRHRSLYEIPELIKRKKLLPVFFFCGEDSYAIEGALKKLISAIEPELSSDFDKEIIAVQKKESIQKILDLALSFPFGGGKKLLIIKDFNNIDDKQPLADYVKNPADFTYLICVQPGKINSVKSEPYATLHKLNYIFEGKKLSQDELVEWLLRHAKVNKVNLSFENALTLVEIVGDEKSLLETTMQKFYDNVGEGGEITFDLITELAASTRKYTIFNLQDEIGIGNKSKALEIAYNLLNSGTDIGQIIAMLSKYCLINAQAIELRGKKLQYQQAAKEAELNPYYYRNSTTSSIFKNKKRLTQAARALYKADLSVKTSAADHKTILAVLISEMISN